jgi:hypothetical protein
VVAELEQVEDREDDQAGDGDPERSAAVEGMRQLRERAADADRRAGVELDRSLEQEPADDREDDRGSAPSTPSRRR